MNTKRLSQRRPPFRPELRRSVEVSARESLEQYPPDVRAAAEANMQEALRRVQGDLDPVAEPAAAQTPDTPEVTVAVSPDVTGSFLADPSEVAPDIDQAPSAMPPEAMADVQREPVAAPQPEPAAGRG